MTRGGWIRQLAVCALFAAGNVAAAQGFNIDLNLPLGDERNGAGVPSAGFGGAANQPGVWNDIYAAGFPGPYPLVGLDGLPTEVSLRVGGTPGGSAGGFVFQGNSCDYARLLNDATQVGSLRDGGVRSYEFHGLARGMYEIFTFAADPHGEFNPTPVTIFGSLNGETHLVTGPMPGNSFAEGLTHTRHIVLVGSEKVTVQVVQPSGLVNAYWVSGFQVRPVSERNTLEAVLILVALFVARRHAGRK